MIKDDGFWNVERLLPPNRRSEKSVPLSQLEGLTPPADPLRFERKYPRSAVLFSASLAEQSYTGAGSFAGFLAEAQRLRDVPPDSAAPYRRYFSYTPCYRDLDRHQLNSFLQFRLDTNKRRYRPVDYSYFVLYCYELLNLANRLPARESLETLLWLWKNYRTDFAVIDKLFCDWVLDFCIEQNLDFPFSALDGILPDIRLSQSPLLYQVYLFDYLLSGDFFPDERQTGFVLRVLCDYRYENLRLYRENALYAGSMSGFLTHLFSRGFLSLAEQRADFLNLKIPTGLKVKRGIYPGAVMDPSRKGTLCLEYCPMIGDVNVKGRFTSLIKYIDNRIRKRLGLKPKFVGVNISGVHQSFIDSCFEGYFASRPVPDSLPSVPAAPAVKREIQVDVQKARAIESDSWQTTDILTKDLYEESGEMVELGAKAQKAEEAGEPEFQFASDAEEDVTELAASLDTLETDFLLRLLYRDLDAAKEYALQNGQFYENLVRRINRKALDTLGDVLMEASGGILDAYREQLEFLFPEDQYLGE